VRTGARGSSKVHMSAAWPSTMSRAPLSGAAADGPSPARGTADAPGGGGGWAPLFRTQEGAGRWGRRILRTGDNSEGVGPFARQKRGWWGSQSSVTFLTKQSSSAPDLFRQKKSNDTKPWYDHEMKL